MNLIWKTALRAALFSAVGAFASVQGVCQAAYTATKNELPLSVYAGAASVDSDYGSKNQTGYFFGLAYTKNFSHIYVVPSFELRASISPMGQDVAESTYQAGFKVEHAYFRRLHPYGEFLIGTGTIRYRAGLQGPGEFSDNSIVPSYGGGVDVDVARGFGVKADFFQQHWRTGTNVTYSPSALSCGVFYRLPFGR